MMMPPSGAEGMAGDVEALATENASASCIRTMDTTNNFLDFFIVKPPSIIR